MRARPDADSALYIRVLKRMIHFFAQQVEDAVMTRSTTVMPPPREGKAHPFQKFVRMTGGKSLLRAHLAHRFMVRGGGFVSVKDETTLQQLGLVSKQSSLGTKTASNFAALHLLKSVAVTEAVLNRSPMPVVNFSCDAARVFKQQASGYIVVASSA